MREGRLRGRNNPYRDIGAFWEHGVRSSRVMHGGELGKCRGMSGMGDEMKKRAGAKLCRAFDPMLRVATVKAREGSCCVCEGGNGACGGPVGGRARSRHWGKSCPLSQALTCRQIPCPALCMGFLL